MKIIPVLFFVLISCLSCSKNDKPEHVKQADKILEVTSKELEKKYNLSLSVVGGSMMKEIKILSLGFSSQETLDMNQARELIMSCAKIFLNNINTSTEIRPYLYNFPATEKNIEIEIYFQIHGVAVKAPKIAVVDLSHGKVVYNNKYERLEEIHRESYEEAMKIVQEEKKED